MLVGKKMKYRIIFDSSSHPSKIGVANIEADMLNVVRNFCIAYNNGIIFGKDIPTLLAGRIIVHVAENDFIEQYIVFTYFNQNVNNSNYTGKKEVYEKILNVIKNVNNEIIEEQKKSHLLMAENVKQKELNTLAGLLKKYPEFNKTTT